MSLLPGLEQMAGAHALMIMGVVPEGAAPMPEGLRTLVLLGPREPGFWAHFSKCPEFLDAMPDPMDRWSRRVIGAIAGAMGARAMFPFGTAPAHPFITWALASGRAFVSPVHLLVHDQAGLWVSYRGALGLAERLEPLPPSRNPCAECSRPCLTACPAGALTQAGYDLPSCHGYLDSAEGVSCLTGGCAVRAVCPLSRAHGRAPAQSAHHMRHFHP